MRPSWEEYWLNMCYFVAMRSIDPDTHVGAVCVSDVNTILSIGYNGFCRGMDDGRIDRLERPAKYHWLEHAERNAIYAAARSGISLLGSSLFTLGIPCFDCGRAIVQAGIKKVVVDSVWDVVGGEKWKEHAEGTRQIFSETGVDLVTIIRKTPLLQISGLINGSTVG